MQALGKPERWMLIAILLVATALRVYDLQEFSLTNDELSALARTHQPSYAAMLEDGVRTGDFHPAGVQTWIWCWTKLFGENPVLLRIPFVICGILSVLLIFLVGRRWSSTYSALTAAALLAVLEYPILFSRLARPYAPGALFALVALYFWSKILFNSKKQGVSILSYAGLALSMVASMYIHHYSALFVGLIGLSGLLFVTKSNWKAYVITGAVALALYLPHIGITSYQMGIGGVGGEGGWLPPPKAGWLVEYMEYAFNGVVMTLLLLALGVLRWSFDRSIGSNWILVLFAGAVGLLMVFIAYWYSIYRNPIFQHSILIFSFPLLVIFVSDLITSGSKKIWILSSILVLLVGLFTTTVSKAFYQTEHFGEFKAIAESTEDWTAKYGAASITYATCVNAPYYAQFYLKDSIPFETYRIKEEEDLLAFDDLVSESSTDHFLFSWSTIQNRPETYAIIRHHYPLLLEDDMHFNSRVSLFSKVSGQPRPFVQQKEYDGSWTNGSSISDSLIHTIPAPQEFGPTWESSLADLGYFSGPAKLTISVEFLPTEANEAILVIESLHNGDQLDWRGASSNDYRTENGVWKTIFLVKEIEEGSNPQTTVKAFLWSPVNSGIQYRHLRLSLSRDI